jgi:chromosome segregation ATPase
VRVSIPENELDSLKNRAEKAEARIAELHQAMIKLTHETPYPEEAEENRQRVGVLLAEVGTLKSRTENAEARIRELEEALRPFAVVEVDSVGNIPDEQAFLWKRQNNVREEHGISIADIKRARHALNPER